MQITINALQYKKNSSGIGVMIRELFGRLPAFSSSNILVILPKDSPGFIHDTSRAAMVHAPCAYGQGLRRMLFQTLTLGRRYCQKAVLLTTDSKIPFFLPKECVVIPLITDLAVYRMRRTYQASRVFWWRMQYQYVKRRADHFLAVSEYTKQDLISLFDIPADRIDVVPCAVSDSMKPVTDPEALSRLRARYSLPQQYILFVGNFNPRKNLARLITAFDQAKEQGLPHQLVIAGEYGWKFNQNETLKDIRHKEAVRFLGFVPDEDLPALYSAASLFAFPTLYEGFGIPVLEAQTCGTPVLTSDCSALPEVGGEAALYVNPEDTGAICAGMLKILTSPALAERLIASGFQNAARFSWTESARRLNQIVEEVTSL